jgi:hypothetical protein
MEDDPAVGTDWLTRYQGLTVDEAKALALLESRMLRVIRPDDAWTLDLRPQRLNIFLTASGDIEQISAG